VLILRKLFRGTRLYGVGGEKGDHQQAFLQLDLATFFHFYHTGKLSECLYKLARVRLVPLPLYPEGEAGL
jgi:hypothetical protein